MAASIFVESRYDPRYDLVEALDGRLFALAWSGSPLRRALARVAGELVRRRAWERLGFARAGDYARERPGLSARELNELAHVDAALAKLPAISAALAEGRLGWSKARLLCRVATAEDEGRWLAAAGTVSAAELAQQVRAIDVGALEAGGAEPCDEEGEREVLRIRVPRRVKTKWGDVKRTVRRVAGEWLPNETCVELVAAEVLSAIRLEVKPEALPPLAKKVHATAARSEVVPAPRPALPAPAPPSPFVEALVSSSARIPASSTGASAAQPRSSGASSPGSGRSSSRSSTRGAPPSSATGPSTPMRASGSASRRGRPGRCSGSSAPARSRPPSARPGARAVSRRPRPSCSCRSCSSRSPSPSSPPGSSARPG